MPSIRIKNFGPIKEGYTENEGFLDIKKCTVFIGNQGSGKSTVAKVLTTMMWIEKQLVRDGIIHDKGSSPWLKKMFDYFSLEAYFTNNTEIEYRGDMYWINIEEINGSSHITSLNGIYEIPKIMYVPAERNFLSAVENAFNMKELPLPLFDFAAEYKEAQNSYSQYNIKLPITTENVSITYKADKDQFYLVGENYEMNILQSSSGYQSLVPLFVVSRELSQELRRVNPRRNSLSVQQSVKQQQEVDAVLERRDISDSTKIQLIKNVKHRYINSCFVNIVEEPEQNLFPSSQRALLNSLLSMNNTIEDNKLLLTTHSPYIIDYLTLAVKAEEVHLKEKNDEYESDINKRFDRVTILNAIVPQSSTIAGEDVAIYELKGGKIILLPNYNGIPSDNNYLNESLAEANRLFDELLEIEEELDR